MVDIRFDHVVVAVRDLAASSERLRSIGFDVRPGGRHPGFGTENAIIRFGLDYIELITVRDRAEAEWGSARGRALVEFLTEHDSGFVGYALAADDLEEVARRFRRLGQDVEGPTAMRRQRPDGTLLEWELLIPGGVAWRRPWPFFIAWGLPDAERLAIETPGQHRLGVTGVGGISVAVDDVEWARALYEAVLGAPSDVWRGGAAFRVGEVTIDLLTRDAAPRMFDGTPGPLELRLRVPEPWEGMPAEIEALPGVHFALSP